MPTDADFMRRLRAGFAEEAAERAQALDSALIEMHEASDASRRLALVEAVFREAHSIKGAARAVDLVEVESLCQALEDVFAQWRRQSGEAMAEDFDVLHRAVDLIRAAAAPDGVIRAPQVKAILRELGELKAGRRPPAATPAAVQEVELPVTVATSVRIPAAKLDAVLTQAEELLLSKSSARRSAAAARRLRQEYTEWSRRWAKLQEQIRTELGAHSTRLEQQWEDQMQKLRALGDRISSLERANTSAQRSLGEIVDRLLEETKKLVMLPFATVVEGFPRLVRDVAKAAGKQVEFRVKGQDIEIDKRVLQEVKDPLIHLLRNAVAHGVEAPATRGGKPPRASIEIAVVRVSASEVEVSVSDDGAGIDLPALRATAAAKGLLSGEEAAALDDEHALALIFRSQFSTSPAVTELAGRGIGLAIVREKVEQLGGRVTVDTRLGFGTTFHLFLPTTLATFHGLVLSVAQQRYVIASTAVDRIVRIRSEDIQPVENRDTISLGAKVIPVVSLARVLGLPEAPPDGRAPVLRPAIVLGTEEGQVALMVETILGEQEILAKRLQKPLLRVRHVAGTTVLGHGQPAVILHAPDLIRTAREPQMLALGPSTAPERQIASLLVVEDSITSRTLLKTILENDGYRVATAVDGTDALALLRTGDYAAVVSDVEMPRLDGFGLTAAIRADPRLGRLPVILVTARGSRQDRERGVEVGANAYITKSSFEGSDLLDAVRRFV